MPPDMPPPATNLQEFGNNAWNDFTGQIQGLKALSSAGAQAFSETIVPKLLYQPNQQAMQQMMHDNPVDAMIPYRPAWAPIHQSDLEIAGQMAGAIGQHYNERYIQPALHGDVGQIGNEFLSQPITTVTDLMPLKGAVGKLGKVARIDQLAQKAAAGSAAMARKIPAVDTLANNIQTAKRFSDTMRNASNNYVDEAARYANPVQEAYNKIPANLRNDVIKAGEMRDLQAYNRLRKIPEVKNFWDEANKHGNQVADMFVKEGLFSPEERLAAKYGPVLRSIRNVPDEINASKKFEEYLHTPKGQQALSELKAKLDKGGHEPVYFGLVKKGEARAVGRMRNQLFGEMRAKIKKADDEPINEFAKEANPNRPDVFNKRSIGIRQAYHEIDAYKVWETRTLQGLKFLRLRDLFAEMLKDPTLAKGGVTVDVHKFFGQLAHGSGMTTEGLDYFLRALPEQANLPKLAADMMNAYLAEGKNSQIVASGNTLFKTLTLGMDAFWMINQALQDAMMASTAMWRSPRDIAASWMAHQMTWGKHEVVKQLPPHWLGGVSQEAESTGIMGTLAKYAPPLHWYMDKVFKGTDASQKYWRTVIGLYSLFRGIEAAQPKARVALKDAFNIMARHEQIVTALKDPAVVNKAGKEINKWMGQYDPLTAQLYAGPRALLPFFLWYKHAAWFSTAAALETPIKNAIVANLSRVAPQILQSEQLNKKERERGTVAVAPEGYPLPGPNGGMLTRTAAGFTPNTQAPDLIAVAHNALFNDHKPIEGLAFSPFINFFMSMFGVNGGAGGFDDPQMLHVDGKQYMPGTHEEVHPRPDLPEIAMRSLLPRQEAVIRAIAAYPNKPSDMTKIGRPAPQVSSQYPDGVKAYSGIQQALFTFLKSTPSEQRVDIEKESRMNKVLEKKLRKADRRQSFRGQPGH
jgi:hypothetical protein